MEQIKCIDVCKSFGEKVALDKVSIDIPKGKIFGLLGPNGAGKTTLIRIINRITIPSSGSVLFDGRPITQDDVEKIGYLPEERGLYRKMKVEDQAMYLAQLKGMSHSEAMSELKKWFIRFGIESWWNKKVEELSKGMAQKIQFITTVVHKPSLLILDEPCAGLDPKGRNDILDQIELLHKMTGITVILVSHSMEDVAKYVERIIVMNKGEVFMDGTPKMVFEHAEELERVGLAAPQVAYVMRKLQEVYPDLTSKATTVEEAKDDILRYLEAEK